MMLRRPRLGLRANAAIGGLLVGLAFAAALVALVWTPYDPLAIDLTQKLQAPSLAHWCGTDEYGRDIASRAMTGAASSGLIALLTVAFAVTAGTLVGIAAGYAGAWVDRVLMTINDALLAFPGILLALGVMAVTGPGRFGLVLALALAYAPTVARVVRAAVLSLREREFIEASRMIGNPEWLTMLRHVLPNCMAPIAVLATSTAAAK